MKKYGVYIGRFQPFHLGHKFVVETALAQCETLIIVIGSAKTWRTESNPFSFEERNAMIRGSLSDEQNARVVIKGVKDYYDDVLWQNVVKAVVAEEILIDSDVAVFGHIKDESSYYLENFPQWDFIDVVNHQMLSATDVRNAFFTEDVSFSMLSTMLCEKTVQFLKTFSKISAFKEICSEIAANAKYKRLWQDAPFPVQFLTADCVVECNKQVLLIERGGFPGKGKLALPGGFINPNERIFDGAVRELFEETKLDIAKSVLKSSLTGSAVFDHPRRSSRGRTVTHTYHFKLPFGHINATASDDAKEVMWVDINRLSDLEDRFFEDHYLILAKHLDLK